MTKLKIAALIAGASLSIFAAGCATAVVNENANKPANMAPASTPKPASTTAAPNSNMKMPANSNMQMPPPKASPTKKP